MMIQFDLYTTFHPRASLQKRAKLSLLLQASINTELSKDRDLPTFFNLQEFALVSIKKSAKREVFQTRRFNIKLPRVSLDLDISKRRSSLRGWECDKARLLSRPCRHHRRRIFCFTSLTILILTPFTVTCSIFNLFV